MKIKKLMILLVLVSTMSITACAQNKNVPEEVKTTFNQKFPDAKKVSWDKENAKEWEAEFKMNGKKYSANFDNKGNWKETEYKISKSDIPAAVNKTLIGEFNDYNIEEGEVSETANGIVYEFALENDEVDMEVAISAKGKVLKKESNKEDNDTEEEKD